MISIELSELNEKKMTVRKLAFYFIASLTVFFNGLAIAQLTYPRGDICKGDNIDCVAPIVGEYLYSSGPRKNFSSAQALIDAHVQSYDTGFYCDIKSFILNVDFTSYSESGSGQKIDYPVDVVFWKYGVNTVHSIYDYYRLELYTEQNRNGQIGCFLFNDFSVKMERARAASCPEGSISQKFHDEACVVTIIPPKECPAGPNHTGNPCQISTGAKLRNEVDFQNQGLSFGRKYHSYNLSDKGFGKGWHNKYLNRLTSISSSSYYVPDGTGRALHWPSDQTISDYQLTKLSETVEVVHAKGHKDIYDHDGNLLKSITASGEETTYSYGEDDLLESVTDSYNKTILFTYDVLDLITAVTDPEGNVYHYEYDEKRNLTAVVYPDATPNDLTDNPRRIYHYEDARFPNHLTGITDANGVRHQTYAYDAEGKAIESAKAQTTNAVPQEQVKLNYQN